MKISSYKKPTIQPTALSIDPPIFNLTLMAERITTFTTIKSVSFTQQYKGESEVKIEDLSSLRLNEEALNNPHIMRISTIED